MWEKHSYKMVVNSMWGSSGYSGGPGGQVEMAKPTLPKTRSLVKSIIGLSLT